MAAFGRLKLVLGSSFAMLIAAAVPAAAQSYFCQSIAADYQAMDRAAGAQGGKPRRPPPAACLCPGGGAPGGLLALFLLRTAAGQAMPAAPQQGRPVAARLDALGRQRLRLVPAPERCARARPPAHDAARLWLRRAGQQLRLWLTAMATARSACAPATAITSRSPAAATARASRSTRRSAVDVSARVGRNLLLPLPERRRHPSHVADRRAIRAPAFRPQLSLDL